MRRSSRTCLRSDAFRTVFQVTLRSQLQLAVANCQSASHRLMKIPGQMVRMTFLAPTAGATTGVRPPLVAPAVPLHQVCNPQLQWPDSDSLTKAGRPGLLVVGWKQNPATPTTPPYPAFRPRRTGHRGRVTPARSCSAVPPSETPRTLGTYSRQAEPMTRLSIDETASFGTQPVSTCALWGTNGTR